VESDIEADRLAVPCRQRQLAILPGAAGRGLNNLIAV